MAAPTVLFVDDDEFVLHSLRRLLVQEPYNKLFARSAFEASDMLKEKDVHVVVSDMKMPVTDGLSFLSDLKERYPDIVRMVLSGYAQVSQIIASINRGEVYRYIAKPWDDGEDLKRIINEGLDFYAKREQRRKHTQELEELKKKIEHYENQATKLTGNLPACRLCHKIHRPDKDDWEHLQAYISHFSDLRFHDTICPSCAGAFRATRTV